MAHYSFTSLAQFILHLTFCEKIRAKQVKLMTVNIYFRKRTRAVRSKKSFKAQRKSLSMEEILNNVTAHENKNYRIYLGLSFE